MANGKTTKQVKTVPAISEDTLAAVGTIVTNYKATYGEEPTATTAEIAKLWDQSDEGIGHEDVREFEGKDASSDAGDAPDNKPSDDTSVVHPNNKAALSTANVALDKEAVTFAGKLNKNPKLVTHLKEWVANEDERKRLPAAIAHDLHTTLAKDDVFATPVPGSRKDPERKNTPYDVREAGKGSWFADLADATDYGATLKLQLDRVRQAMGKTEDKATPEEYQNRSRAWLLSEETTIISRRNALKNALKTGMSVVRRLYEVPEETKLKASIRTEGKDGEKTVIRTATPIEIYFLVPVGDDQHERVSKFLPVNTFLRADLEKVAAEATEQAQLDAFSTTRSRGDTAADNNVTIANVPQMESAVAEFEGWERDAKLQADLMVTLMKPENKSFLISFGTAAKLFDRIMAKPTIRKAYHEAVMEQAERDKADEKSAA